MLIDFSQGENTVREKFMLIDPEQFQGFYSRLVEPLLHKFTSRIVAVDGQAVKASRRSGERASEHILTFYDTENRVVLGQKLIGNKENEISHASSAHSRINAPGNPKLMHQRSLESFLFLC